jgi:hypothetical protein
VATLRHAAGAEKKKMKRTEEEKAAKAKKRKETKERDEKKRVCVHDLLEEHADMINGFVGKFQLGQDDYDDVIDDAVEEIKREREGDSIGENDALAVDLEKDYVDLGEYDEIINALIEKMEMQRMIKKLTKMRKKMQKMSGNDLTHEVIDNLLNEIAQMETEAKKLQNLQGNEQEQEEEEQGEEKLKSAKKQREDDENEKDEDQEEERGRKRHKSVLELSVD